MPLDTIGIGLTSRIVFVYADTPRRKPAFPVLTTEQKVLGEMLAQDLIMISDIAGEFLLSPEAKQTYEDWYEERVQEPNKSGDPRLAGYFERKPMHLLKVAMIVAASYRDGTTIELPDLQMAIALFDSIETRMPKVFASVGKNPINADKEEVYAMLLHTNGMTMGQLLDKFSYTLRKDELVEVLDTLVMIGKIKIDNRTYRPTNPVIR
jgi:hypothetical protein